MLLYGFCACPACVGSYLIDSGGRFLDLLAGGRPAATHFLLLRQKKVSKEKATLLSATPTLRYGAPCGTRFKRGPRKLAALKQRAALIRLKLRSSAHTAGLGRMRARNPYCPFSPWEKAGMRASGGRATTGFCFKEHQVRLLFAFKGSGSNSQSPHPNLLPGGEGGIPKTPSAILLRASCLLTFPPPVLAGPVLHGKNGIRAARCLSEASLRGPPFFPGSAGCPKRSAGTQTAGRLSFAYFSLAKQRKVSRRRAIPGQQLSAKPTTGASK